MIIHDYILGLSSFILECALDTKYIYMVWVKFVFSISWLQDFNWKGRMFDLSGWLSKFLSSLGVQATVKTDLNVLESNLYVEE